MSVYCKCERSAGSAGRAGSGFSANLRVCRTRTALGDQMTQYPVVSFPDIASVEGESKHQLSSKAILHQVPDAETSLFRVKPGGRIKSHYHNKVWDLFFGVSGSGEIAYVENGEERSTPFRAGSFCAMPP